MSFLAVSQPAFAVSPQTVTLSPEVAALVAPVLNAYALVAEHDDSKSESVLDEKLQNILNSHAPAANEALAVLLGFYVGEASGEDISCELVARGNTVVPLLHRYADTLVIVPGANKSQAQHINAEYSIVEKRISSGEQCVREK
jgi:hypothetical protein